MRLIGTLVLGLGTILLTGCGEEFPPLGPPLPYDHPALLKEFKADPVKVDLNLLFIHHSCGRLLLADWNGGLKKELEKQGFKVHTATYGSDVGEQTDIIHWVPKFMKKMDAVLSTRLQDKKLPEGQTNQVVLFKSCYPNNHITGEGLAKVANFKAAYSLLLPIFAKHPKVLFVALAAPPLREEDTTPEAAKRAVEFNQWLVQEWPKAQKNVAAFDFFGVLRTQEGYLNYPTGDSHPSKPGNRRATKALIPFLFKALRRAGMVE